MSSKKNRLNALADIFQSDNLEGNIITLPMEDIAPSETQPRKDILIGIDELAKSIKEDGLLQPIIVTKRDDQYHIIAGERRYRACLKLGRQEIECRILDKDPKESYRLAVIENLQRENLSPFEEAQAMQEMKRLYDFTDEQLAKTFNKSRSYMTEILSIATIPDKFLDKAQDAGIRTKNFLIQLYQAFKRSQADEFIEAFVSGDFTTVKGAKEYNSGGNTTAEKSPKKPTTAKKQAKAKLPGFASKWKGTDLTLSFESSLSSADKKQIASILKSALK